MAKKQTKTKAKTKPVGAWVVSRNSNFIPNPAFLLSGTFRPLLGDTYVPGDMVETKGDDGRTSAKPVTVSMAAIEVTEAYAAFLCGECGIPSDPAGRKLRVPVARRVDKPE